jgi:hypothetical protein
MRKARFTEEQMVAIQRQPTQLVERPNRDSGTHLFRSTDVSETIGRDHVVDLVVGNRRPCQPTACLCPKAEDGNRRKRVLQRARQRSG